MLSDRSFFFSLLMPKLKLAGEKVALTELARVRSMRPPPVASTPTRAALSTAVNTSFVAVLINTDLICSGENNGYSCFMSAAAPATCGVAWLVPLTPRNPLGSTTPSDEPALIAPE